MGDYKYEPINVSHSEVRILILLPGSRRDPVETLLYKRALTADDFPHYEAISYAWGSQNDLVGVAVRTASEKDIDHLFGKDNEIAQHWSTGQKAFRWLKGRRRLIKSRSQNSRQVHVTRNLACALPYLRFEDRPRALWVDALCVDQRNLEERSQQVQRMADIYQLAVRVVVWLGEKSENSELAIDTLEEIRSKVHFNFRTHALSLVDLDDSEVHWANRNISMRLELGAAISIVDLCLRPWFHRLWVRQEIYLGGDASVLLCGTRSIKWKDLRNSLTVYFNKGPGTYDEALLGGDQTIMDRFRIAYGKTCVSTMSLCAGGISEDFITLVVGTRNTQCLDPRDRLYALLSLMSRAELEMKPDYTKEPHQIFREMMQSLLASSGSLRYLCLCQIQAPPSAFPSWVPNLGEPIKSTMIRHTSTTFFQEPPPIVDDILHTKGAYITTIKQVYKSQLVPGANRDELIEELYRLLHALGPFPEPQRMEDLVRTLVQDVVAESHHPPSASQQSVSTVDDFRNLAHDDEPPDPFDPLTWLSPYFVDFGDAFFGRSLFVDENGQFGLCPITTEVEDVVVYLIDCGTPLVLRRTTDDKWLVVGEAYHHGSMCAEVLLGPLPPSFRRVWGVGNVVLFLNDTTGETQVEDPRLGDLPAGWVRGEPEEGYIDAIFVRESTGEKYYSSEFDPRATPEEIERRGVVLQKFLLA